MRTSVTRVNKAFLAACALACAALVPARAGLFDDDEARRRIQSLRDELAQQGRDNEARIVKLEEQIRNIGVVELVRQLDELNAEIARLRGQIEVLANENQQLQKRQRDFYLDLDSRMKRLEGGGSSSPAPPAPSPDASTPGFSPQASTPVRAPTREEQARETKAYDAASNLFRRNDFPAAVEAFRTFVKDYPSSPLAASFSRTGGSDTTPATRARPSR